MSTSSVPFGFGDSRNVRDLVGDEFGRGFPSQPHLSDKEAIARIASDYLQRMDAAPMSLDGLSELSEVEFGRHRDREPVHAATKPWEKHAFHPLKPDECDKPDERRHG